jgi:hypothetical protein
MMPVTELPAPLTPADGDLRNFPFTPIFRARLFGSSFHARTSDSEWRAGVTLWLKSWDQVPAGSLPDDDVDLCRLAELGRDLKTWREVKAGAMRSWIKCSDGRWYHPVVAEGVNEALEGKKVQRLRTLKARVAALRKALDDAKAEEAKDSITRQINALSLELSQAENLPVTASVTGPVTESNRKGQGQGQGYSSEANASGEPPSDDPARVLWTLGVSILTAAGQPEKNARGLVGKWRAQLRDDEKLIAILRSAQKHGALDPVAYIARAVSNETRPRSGMC